MKRVFDKYREFRDRQDGNATIEFVILFPAFIFLFLTGFEAGYYMVRNVMLERALDVAVRDVRLGNGQVPDFVALKKRICSEIGLIDDCSNSLQVEMQPIAIQPGGVASVDGPTRCVDKDVKDDPLTGTVYDVGQSNQMMMVRVCVLTQPLFPTTGIGVGMRANGRGDYALVATTAFVNEPGTRAMSGSGSGGSSSGTGSGGGIGAGGGNS